MLARLAATAALLIAAASAVSVSALADCKQEVVDAFQKQRQKGSFRSVARMINERGPVKMTVDYVLPDRMHQTVKAAIDPSATETILVGNRAWVSNGSGWQPLPLEDANQVVEAFQGVLKADKEQPVFDCLGYVEVEGRTLRAYEAMADKTAPPGAPTRMVYIDPTTGLPVRSIVALKDKLDRPFFAQDYSYPADLSIEPPQTAQ